MARAYLPYTFNVMAGGHWDGQNSTVAPGSLGKSSMGALRNLLMNIGGRPMGTCRMEIS